MTSRSVNTLSHTRALLSGTSPAFSLTLALMPSHFYNKLSALGVKSTTATASGNREAKARADMHGVGVLGYTHGGKTS